MTDIMSREPIPELPPARERARLRKSRGVTQIELAGEIGVSRQTVIAWERGSEPAMPHRAKYAEILRAWKERKS